MPRAEDQGPPPPPPPSERQPPWNLELLVGRSRVLSSLGAGRQETPCLACLVRFGRPTSSAALATGTHWLCRRERLRCRRRLGRVLTWRLGESGTTSKGVHTAGRSHFLPSAALKACRAVAADPGGVLNTLLSGLPNTTVRGEVGGPACRQTASSLSLSLSAQAGQGFVLRGVGRSRRRRMPVTFAGWEKGTAWPL